MKLYDFKKLNVSEVRKLTPETKGFVYSYSWCSGCRVEGEKFYLYFQGEFFPLENEGVFEEACRDTQTSFAPSIREQIKGKNGDVVSIEIYREEGFSSSMYVPIYEEKVILYTR